MLGVFLWVAALMILLVVEDREIRTTMLYCGVIAIFPYLLFLLKG